MGSQSPRITHFSWGKIEIDDGRSFGDAKLFPGGARGWDWRETGTRHNPGIQPSDVEELVVHGARVIILSKGINEALRVDPSTTKMLDERQITFHILQTEKAVHLYNELREKELVGGLFHSTC